MLIVITSMGVLKHKPRIANTGEKVRNVLVILWREELERYGHTYGDLLGYLDDLQIQCAVSPWHDRDTWTSEGVLNWCTMHINPETGDLDEQYIREHDDIPAVGKNKKAHVHMLIKLKSQQTAQWFTNLFGGFIPINPVRWEKCYDVEASVCYFAHLHSPEKYPYDPSGIHAFGGLDTSCLLKKTEKHNTELLNAAHDLIDVCHIHYYYQLVQVAREQDDELFSFIVGKHSHFQSFLNSQRYEKQDKQKREKSDRNVEK